MPSVSASVKIVFVLLTLVFLSGIAEAEKFYDIGSVSANTLYRITVASARSDCRDVQFLSGGSVITPSFSVLHSCSNGYATLSFLFTSSYSSVIVKSQNSGATWITYTVTGYANAYLVSLGANQLTEINGISTSRSDTNDIRFYTLSGSMITPSTYWRPAATSGVNKPVIMHNTAGTYIVVSGKPDDTGYSQSSYPVATSTSGQSIFQAHGVYFEPNFAPCPNGMYFKLYNSSGQYYSFYSISSYGRCYIYHPTNVNARVCICSGSATCINPYLNGTWTGSTLSYSISGCFETTCDGLPCCDCGNIQRQSYSASGVAITQNVYFTADSGWSGYIAALRYSATASVQTKTAIEITASVTALTITKLQNAYKVDFTISGSNHQFNYAVKYRTNPTASYTTAATLSGYPGSYNTTISTSVQQIEVVVEVSFSSLSVLASRTELYDVNVPLITNIRIIPTLTTVMINASLSDNWLVASYQIKINDLLAASNVVNAQSANISVQISGSYFSKDSNTIVIIATDTKGNNGQNSTTYTRLYSITFVIFNIERNEVWNAANYTVFEYLALKNYATNEQINIKANNTTQITVNLLANQSIALEWRYTGYATTFVNEIEPWIVNIFNSTVIRLALPPPQTLYQVIAYSVEERKVAFIDPTTNAVGAAGTTKYAFEQYKAFPAWLKPGVWSVHTIANGIPTYLAPINPQAVASINLDALIALVKPSQIGFFSASITCKRNDVNLQEITFTSMKPGALLLQVKDGNILKYQATANGDKIVVLVNTTQLGITREYFSVEGYVDGSLKARVTCHITEGATYYLPEWLAIALAVSIVFFSFTAVGFYTMFRFLLPIASLAAIYITSVTTPTTMVRFVQIISLILFVVSILFIIRWRGGE